MHGLAVTTVEGIGSTKSKLHPVQERIAKSHGSQCGFCTPGIVMSMYALLRNMQKPSLKDLETAFQGNLCRCTGYRPIIEGFKTFTEEWEQMQQQGALGNNCGMGDKCCKLPKNAKSMEEEGLFAPSEFAPLDPSQEPIFPPHLKVSDAYDTENLMFKSNEVTFYRPTTLETLLELKSQHPEAKIVVGNTELGVEVKFKNMLYTTYILPNLVKEMTRLEVLEDGLSVGASVTLQDLDTQLRQQIKEQPDCKCKIFSAIVEMFHWFAGKQIRNVAAIGGNIMAGSPISDLNPILIAAKAELTVRSFRNGTRKIVMDELFFTGYRRNVLEPDEVLTSIKIPFTEKGQFFFAYKQARRREDDIAIVNSAFNIQFEKNTDRIADIRLAFGGMAPTTVVAPKTGRALIGETWNEQMLEKAYSTLVEDLPLPPDAPGGMTQYRRSLTLSMFFRVFLKVSNELKAKLPEINIPREYLSGMDPIQTKTSCSSQYFNIVPDSQEKTDAVGRPVHHAAALQQSTGEAVFCDDIPKVEGELHMGLVRSTRPHANILSLDATDALKMPGVHAFFSAKDLEQCPNSAGTIVQDQEIFVSKTVTSEGQIIGAIVAEDQLVAKKAAKAVKIRYEDIKPTIVTIEDAIEHNSFFNAVPITYGCGDVEKAFEESEHVLQGQCRTGAQEHFYLETNCCIVTPKSEDDEMEIVITSQHPTDISSVVSRFLGVPLNKIITKVKRIGGGFGGKESRPFVIALPAAFAAKRLGRRVRCMLDRDEDILLTGGRHPFLMKYKIGFNSDGKLNGCEVLFYNNGGYSLDLSVAVSNIFVDSNTFFTIP